MIFEFYIKYKNKKEISYSTECVFLFLFYVNIFASTQKKNQSTKLTKVPDKLERLYIKTIFNKC